jgi:hypothetical protein
MPFLGVIGLIGLVLFGVIFIVVGVFQDVHNDKGPF